ncbi:MAG: HD domain-containing protein [bacterium]|nr:HD domain-containing protein [bacterium]
MDNYEFLLITELENYFGNDLKRINHAMKVLNFAKAIMQKEGGDSHIIVPSAILHDIGIKECERKYNSVAGELQEKESPLVALEILRKIAYPDSYISEIIEIISHHHSIGMVKTLNFQVLFEADWLVNLGEDYKDVNRIQKETMINNNFQTKAGMHLVKILYLE